MAGRPSGNLTLSPTERETLENWSQRRSTSQALALRAKIILACSQPQPNVGIASQLGISRDTVAKWRSRFIAAGLAGLQDASRPGAPRRIADLQVGEVIRRTLEAPGPGADGAWSTRSMAAKMGISQSTVSRIWRAHGLQPQPGRAALPPPEDLRRPARPSRSAGQLLAGQVAGIAGLLFHPLAKCLALCADMGAERAIRLPGPAVPPPDTAAPPGTAAPSSTAVSPPRSPMPDGAGRRRPRPRHQELLRFLRLVDETVPADLEVHLICDRRTPFTTPAVRDWLRARPRFRVHLTPAAASWLSTLERWFTELAVAAPPAAAAR